MWLVWIVCEHRVKANTQFHTHTKNNIDINNTHSINRQIPILLKPLLCCVPMFDCRGTRSTRPRETERDSLSKCHAQNSQTQARIFDIIIQFVWLHDCFGAWFCFFFCAKTFVIAITPINTYGYQIICIMTNREC